MSKGRKPFTDEFKREAVQFAIDHPEMTNDQCVEYLGIGRSTFARWKRQAKEQKLVQENPTASIHPEPSAEREIAKLQRELRDSQETLKILKKPSIDSESLPMRSRRSGGSHKVFCFQSAAHFRQIPIRLL